MLPSAVRPTRIVLPGLLTLFFLSGCYIVEYTPPDPLTPDEIVAMSKAGSTPEEIVNAIRDSQTIYQMDAKDVVRLSEQGVHESVIDYMMQTERQQIRREAYAAPHYDPWHYHYYQHFPHASYYCW
jgi:hypothetical protein